MRIIEVFADMACPFTHVGLRRFREQRAATGTSDVVLVVRAWPLELVNGTPLDPEFVTEEIQELRASVAPDLFGGFRTEAMPASSLPAMALAAAAYRHSPQVGEEVSIELRDLLFEKGCDIAEPEVLRQVATAHGLEITPADTSAPAADHEEGAGRGVIGSPHWFTAAGDFFCPALDISRDGAGRLHIAIDRSGFERFMGAALGEA